MRAICARSLKEHPQLNASWVEETQDARHKTQDASSIQYRSSIIVHKSIHIGFAVDPPRGLVVPVVHNADSKPLAQIHHELTDLVARTLEGKVLAHESDDVRRLSDPRHVLVDDAHSCGGYAVNAASGTDDSPAVALVSSRGSDAARQVVRELDSNAFAHIWKDGIQGSREDQEVVATKRCRLFVALGRLLREKFPTSKANIIKYAHAERLEEHETLRVLEDSCHREILRDSGGEYRFVLPLFADWLSESGFNRIITDSLALAMCCK